MTFFGALGDGKATEARGPRGWGGVPQLATGDTCSARRWRGPAARPGRSASWNEGRARATRAAIGWADERLSRPDAAGATCWMASRERCPGRGPDVLLRRLGHDLDRVVFFDVCVTNSCAACLAAGSAGSAGPSSIWSRRPRRWAGPGRSVRRRARPARRRRRRHGDRGSTSDETETVPLLDYDRHRGLLARVAGEVLVDQAADCDPEGGQGAVVRVIFF